MKRYFIEEAKCGITKGGMACGPVPGSVVVSIKYNDGGKKQWLNLVEVDGMPNVFLTDRDVYDILIEDNYDDEEFNTYINDCFITNLDGIEFDDSYWTTFQSITENPDNPAIPLVRYLITLTRCEMDDVEELIAMASGKFADELDIPQSDEEEEYYAELEEEEEEDEEE